MWLIISEADRAPAYLKLFNVLICSQALESVVMIVQGFLLFIARGPDIPLMYF